LFAIPDLPHTAAVSAPPTRGQCAARLAPSAVPIRQRSVASRRAGTRRVLHVCKCVCAVVFFMCTRACACALLVVCMYVCVCAVVSLHRLVLLFLLSGVIFAAASFRSSTVPMAPLFRAVWRRVSAGRCSVGCAAWMVIWLWVCGCVWVCVGVCGCVYVYDVIFRFGSNSKLWVYPFITGRPTAFPSVGVCSFLVSHCVVLCCVVLCVVCVCVCVCVREQQRRLLCCSHAARDGPTHDLWCVCMYVCMYGCLCMYVCVCMCMYVCVCVCVCVC
jgi:hypothetical protein